MSYGLFSKSMGLVADSLDMLADSFVYAISLIAVGKSLLYKKTIAKIAGYFQIVLALLGLGEVIRRIINPVEFPNYLTMIIISIFALIGNGICLHLLQRSRNKIILNRPPTRRESCKRCSDQVIFIQGDTGEAGLAFNRLHEIQRLLNS